MSADLTRAPIAAGAEDAVDGKKIDILGLGTSGAAVADVLARTEAVRSGRTTVRGIDARATANPRLAGIEFILAADPDKRTEMIISHRPDWVVISPGIPAHDPIWEACASAGIDVISEVELAWRMRAARGEQQIPWVAVTGTNGKTTVVSMVAAILKEAGLRAPAVGNVGQPVITHAVILPDDGGPEALALELSSFQLHATASVELEAAAIMNIADDHLDWHGDFSAYLGAKARIYHRIKRAGFYPVGDERLRAALAEADVHEGALGIGLTTATPALGQLGVVDGILCDRALTPARHRGAAQELGELKDLAHLAGGDIDAIPPHLVMDALAAAGLAICAGADAAAVQRGLAGFSMGAHRIAHLGEKAAVAYIDDSKATNPHAVIACFAPLRQSSVVWIAGGQTKGADMDALCAAIAPKLHAAVLIGVERSELRAGLLRHAPAIPVIEIPVGEDGRQAMDAAVREAAAHARAGDTVVLSPGCASLDQFASYAARGEAFAAAVSQLPEARE